MGLQLFEFIILVLTSVKALAAVELNNYIIISASSKHKK